MVAFVVFPTSREFFVYSQIGILKVLLAGSGVLLITCIVIMDSVEQKDVQVEPAVEDSHNRDAYITSGFELSSLYILVGVILLLPVFFLPFLSAPFQFTKVALVFVGTLISFGLFIVGRLKAGSLPLPFYITLLAAWLLPLTYFFSGVLSSANPLVSFVGNRFEIDTVFFIAMGTLLLTLVPLVVREKQHILGVYAGFLFMFLLLVFYQGLRLIFGGDFLTLGIFTTETSNLLGKWNDLAIFFGVTAMLALVTLEGLKLHHISKAVLYGVLVVSLFFLAIINFIAVWITLGIFALGFFIYNLLKDKIRFPHTQSEEKETSFLIKLGKSAASFAVLVIAVVFIFWGNTIGTSVDSFFNFNQLEVRPSWQGTVGIARATYEEDLFFGSGPNTFASQWEVAKPEGVNTTVFWNARFDSGIGFVPTSFITTGVLGGIAWIIFFGCFLFSGVRSLLLRPITDSFTYYLSLSSFLVAFFLWVFVAVYIPNAVILLLAFFFTGLYLASLRFRGDEYSERTFVFAENPRLGFVSVLGLTVLLIFSGVGVYLVTDRYLASIHFQKAVLAFQNEGDEIEARRSLNKAQTRVQNDTYARFATDLEIRKLTTLLAETSDSPQEQRAQFEEVLAAAIEQAQTARDINPNNHQNWFTLGRVYQTVVPLQIQGAYDNAKESYQRALLLAPHNPSIYLALAELEAVEGNTETAKNYIRQALEEKSNYTAAVFLLAQIQINEGAISDAIQSVEAAGILEPRNPVVFFQLGLLKYNQSDWEGAAAAFERAVGLNTSYANARYFLGLTYHRLNRIPEAIAQFEQVAETNPDNAEVGQIIQNLLSGNNPLQGLTPPEEPLDRDTLPIEGE